jgi:preprotein translocase subunit SecF
MEFFKHATNIDFMGKRTYAAVFSVILFTLSIISLAFHGLHYGLDFTGGTQLELAFKQATHLADVRTTLQQAGFNDVVVQSYGTTSDVLISLPPIKQTQASDGEMQGGQSELTKKVVSLFPTAQLVQVEYIGPQVGEELASKGIMAVIAALIAIMAYISIRFEYRFAVSAAVALIHDPILILGLFSFFQWEFDLNVLAAVLAVIGYSLNDTIVVYDRIRENFRKLRKTDVVEVVNSSINQTLSRTIMTSGLTLMVVLALFIFGGKVIEGFATALIIGIVIGTYSSIYVAGALAVKLGLKRQDLLPHAREAANDQP